MVKEESYAYVYALRPLNSGLYFYVGKTTRNPEERLLEHLEKARSGKSKNADLLEKLKNLNFCCAVDIIVVCSRSDVGYSELQTIKKMSKEFKLTNKIGV